MRFVILGSERTGSTHFVTQLGRQPDIACHAEVFHRNRVHLRWPEWPEWPKGKWLSELEQELHALRKHDVDEFIERIYATNFGRPHIGFKIFRGQNNDVLEKLIDDSSIRKIILFRRNVLAIFASALAARKTNVWDVKDPVAGTPKPKIQFDAASFTKFFNRYIRGYRESVSRLNRSGQQYHFLNYEDLNNPSMFTSVLAFIGAEPAVAHSDDALAKRRPSNILERFSNASEVEKFLKERGLEHWIYEGEMSFDSWPVDAGSEVDTKRR